MTNTRRVARPKRATRTPLDLNPVSEADLNTRPSEGSAGSDGSARSSFRDIMRQVPHIDPVLAHHGANVCLKQEAGRPVAFDGEVRHETCVNLAEVSSRTLSL